MLPVYERVFGPEHPRTLNLRANLAAWIGETGDAGAAADEYAELLPLHERVLGTDHPDTVAVRRNLTFWSKQAGRRRRRWRGGS
jgi:hypothetical protein